MNKEEVKIRLSDLINRYNDTLRKEKHENVSEETVRTWINEFLGLFGWNVQDTNQVLQERTLSGTPQQRLQEINSPHKRPDYILLNGLNIKSFLDAKSLDVDIFTDADVAYQIRSYGWSAQSPCAFVSNFEQFVIYDTRFVPDPSQPANASTIQLHIDDYLNQFDVLFDHLWHDNICRNHLNELYATTATEGRNRVDSQFMTVLSSFRKKLAVELFWNNPDLICSDIALNYYVQVILDRIVFIRVCESKGIEELEKLKQFEKKPEGFWEVFKASCYMEFYTHYDGAMFERDEIFQKIALSDNVFKDFISQLYYPYPYKFDVIPVKVIANIYEEFLGKQLVINNGEVEEVSKEEYIRTNGAIATPEHIVEMVCKQTISLDHVQTVDDLLNITILDPCCGSGVFLVSCYERLAAKMLSILSLNESERTLHNDFFCDNDGQMLLTVSARRAIAKQCIYAIDFDEAAIEVTKMSLALKIVDGNDPLAWEGLGVYGDKILQEIANNIKLGNTLVGMEQSFSPEQIVAIKPFDPCAAFPVVYAKRDGFDYVIGNPPYVETKHYKAALPAMHGYLSNKYSSFEGKADLAVLFIERGLQLLNNQGKLGFIIQRRWFKTEYGSVARLLINSGRYLEKLIDFKATDIFDGRIVYASIMVLSKEGNDHLLYYYMPSDASEIRIRFENSTDDGSFEGCSYEHIPCQSGSSPWLFDSFADFAIEKGICIPIVKPNTIKTELDLSNNSEVAIFPYERQSGSISVIDEAQLKIQFPKTLDFLSAHRAILEARDKGHGDYPAWYAYGRTQGMNNFGKKLLIPYIAGEPTAVLSLDESLLFYCGYALFSDSEEELRIIKAFLKSDAFWYYIFHTSKPYSKGYMALAKNYIVHFSIPKLSEEEKAYILSTPPRSEINDFIWRKYNIDTTLFNQ